MREHTAEEKNDFMVPENEVEFAFARSGGPGGQNVNRRATKAQLRWDFEHSSALNEEQKAILRDRLAGWINKEGVITLEAQEERSQPQNRRIVLEKLNAAVVGALVPEKERIATRPTRASRRKRLEGKLVQSRKKKSRRFADEG